MGQKADAEFADLITFNARIIGASLKAKCPTAKPFH